MKFIYFLLALLSVSLADAQIGSSPCPKAIDDSVCCLPSLNKDISCAPCCRYSDKYKSQKKKLITNNQLLTNEDFEKMASRDFQQLIGTNDGKVGTSKIALNIINPAANIDLALPIKSKPGNIPVAINFGGSLKFNDPISQLNFKNPNIEGDINFQLNLMLRSSLKFSIDQKFTSDYAWELVQQDYRSAEIDAFKKQHNNNHYKTIADSISVLKKNIKTAGSDTANKKQDLSNARIRLNYFTDVWQDSLTAMKAISKTSKTRAVKDSLTKADKKFKLDHINQDDLWEDTLNKMVTAFNKAETDRQTFIDASPINTKKYHWFSIKTGYKRQSFNIYDDNLPVSDKSITRAGGNVLTLSVNYNYYHYVNEKFGRLRYGGNMYIQGGIDLLYNNAADNGKYGPYKIQISDTLSNGSRYVKKEFSAYNKKAFNSLISLYPHADFFIMGTKKHAGFHALCNFKQGITTSEKTSSLNFGMGVFASINASALSSGKTGSPSALNFEFLVTAGNLLDVNSKTSVTSILQPEIKFQLPFTALNPAKNKKEKSE